MREPDRSLPAPERLLQKVKAKNRSTTRRNKDDETTCCRNKNQAVTRSSFTWAVRKIENLLNDEQIDVGEVVRLMRFLEQLFQELSDISHVVKNLMLDGYGHEDVDGYCGAFWYIIPNNVPM
ncbi:unnamed protein product [Nesidiocoris tenuis]|uniref:Uncharacterized protein n=1 Tax=Nesidiocoris tenuis TaxID=355587 RepID=A0A6H5GU25_9HEMI|nr:unnamed protein product [Nesidiocoris tenuis]CAB0006312.1 unnamed protein product [Nesidiocoris tenuis]